MFALFERNGKTEKYTKLYNKLAEIDPKAQGKVLSFYTEVKGKRPETDVLQGIYSLMRYYRDPSAFDSKAVLDLFPDIGPRYVNVNQSEVDEKQIEADKKQIEAYKKQIEANKKATKLMRELRNAL